MVKKLQRRPRRDESLSREQIITAAIELLDSGGESGLTFRNLSGYLATGPGALYGHVENKRDLIEAACSAVIDPCVDLPSTDMLPTAAIRHVALAMFDAMDAHPWVGSALAWAAGQSTMVSVLERIGQQVQALGVAPDRHWVTVSVLLNYILGVGRQNASNAQQAQRRRKAERAEVLGEVANAWLQLDPDRYPFTRSIAAQMSVHDDRADFLAGIDLILAGIGR
ncbi:TetR/AcrR family transcriptional regulator [Herbaspirillum sp. YR522]|uniref:TetR/AcrR family transcriptional regulator n=1 Tax=Herbaspirillum sp. YR522 TaxID=1144342 RepID=UPI00026F5C40|nr:TetR/AcrR family transcriptional regulator C-terminal domain-containing protein [Herbaspirillum sp. YR522]EJN08342.1 transcriptional regulator [Herbaspirillum sp. YR522]